MQPIWIGCANKVRWKGLRLYPAGAYVNNATVLFSLYDEDDALLSSVTADYQAGSNGDYIGAFPYTVKLTEGTRYFLTAIATQGSNRTVKRLELIGTYKGAF
jgi:hypothetical protein